MSRLASLLLLLPLVFLSSCTGGFPQRWDSTAPPMSANPAALMAGKWQGTWQSDATDYWGQLQAIIVPTTITVENEEVVQQYEATFFKRVFEVPQPPTPEFTVTLSAKKLPDGRLHFIGKKDLGYHNGGIFVFDGFVYPKDDKFYCDYDSDKDVGTFKMSRITQQLINGG